MDFNNCRRCNKEIKKGNRICRSCYMKYEFKGIMVICVGCKRTRRNHSKGYCTSCYNTTFHYDSIRRHNVAKRHKITLEEYDEITRECKSCGHTNMIQLHHLNGDNKDDRRENLVGLCANCHYDLHTEDTHNNIKENLARNGIFVPANFKIKNWGRTRVRRKFA